MDDFHVGVREVLQDSTVLLIGCYATLLSFILLLWILVMRISTSNELINANNIRIAVKWTWSVLTTIYVVLAWDYLNRTSLRNGYMKLMWNTLLLFWTYMALLWMYMVLVLGLVGVCVHAQLHVTPNFKWIWSCWFTYNRTPVSH